VVACYDCSQKLLKMRNELLEILWELLASIYVSLSMLMKIEDPLRVGLKILVELFLILGNDVR